MSAEPPEVGPRGSCTLTGIAGSPGVAIGQALVIGDTSTPVQPLHIAEHHIEAEIQRLSRAIQEATAYLRVVMDSASRVGGELAILDAYVLMLNDTVLMEETERRIRLERKAAEWAVSSAMEDLALQFEGAEDLYLRERGHDFQFVGEMIVRALRGGSEAQSVIHLDRPSIVVARDLSPADTAAMVREPVLGFVTEVGTRTSHTSIMARALEIPAVVGVTDALARIRTGDELVVDGLRGEVIVRPTAEELNTSRRREQHHLLMCRQLSDARDMPAATACGTPIVLRANVELPGEVAVALARGAQGIGLYRTEFLYINRGAPPSEDEQYALYRTVLEATAPHSVTLRTFDIGGDKFVSSVALPSELNPALGLRAVRLGLSRPDLFLQQLRAMVRASVHGALRIMIPMVATLTELRKVRALLDQAIVEVESQGNSHAPHIGLGVMMEVPSAALLADRFAREADFMSLGTNDLIQYTLAADRTNRSLAYLASPFDPAILRLIHWVAQASLRHNKPLSLCGEMASDPLGAILLTGLGLREFSMESSAVPEIKETLRRVTLQEAEEASQEALQQDTAEMVEQLMARIFAPRLYDLLGASR